MESDAGYFQDCLSRYRDELLGSVIPFWETHCLDEEFGGYFTFLDRDGSVYDTNKFMWMQWRIVYMFATLAGTDFAMDLPGKKDRWREIALHGFEFLSDHGRDEDGNHYFALDRTGRPIIAPYNIYSEAFATMGAAALYKETGESRFKKYALDSMENYLSRLQNPKGRWNKALEAAPRRLSHGHYMILANLGSVLEECLGVDTYKEEVARAVKMVIDHFWNQEHGIIFENINEDLSLDLSSCDGRHLNPGHALESEWFILSRAEKEGDRYTIDKVIRMIVSTCEKGWDGEHGGIFYFLDALDKPHQELTWNMKLWWVHCEALVATLMAYRLSEDARCLEWFKRIDSWTWNHFPDKEHGEWFGYLDRAGRPTHYLKGGKWKTFFHLPRALLACTYEFERLLE